MIAAEKAHNPSSTGKFTGFGLDCNLFADIALTSANS